MKVFGWICLAIAAVMGYQTWNVQKENHRLSLEKMINTCENRILKDELSQMRDKPTYEMGYKDAIVKMGGPQSPGAYQDGWDDAVKTIEPSYATGYHAAIQQFGYMKPKDTRWLVPQPVIDVNAVAGK